MKIKKTYIKDLLILEYEVFKDNRGFFTELYNSNVLKQYFTITNHLQDNLSYNKYKYTLRGMHFQLPPYQQSKIVYCVKGKIKDTVIDLRKGSPTYLKSFSIELSEENKKALIIPSSFAHGFMTLEDESLVMYKVDNIYKSDCSMSINFKDFNLVWPVNQPNAISEKDKFAPFFSRIDSPFKVKVAITGANGQLGSNLYTFLKKQGYECCKITLDDIKYIEEDCSENKIKLFNPDVIVHCAAVTDVTFAEENKEYAKYINYNLTKKLVDYCKVNMSKIIFISTDYVFDGESDSPYSPNSTVNPINFYGKTKVFSENYIKKHLENYLILRTSWLSATNHNNFIEKIIEKLEIGSKFSVVDNEIGSPTFVKDLVEIIENCISKNTTGIVHATNSGHCSRYSFAKKIEEFFSDNHKESIIVPYKASKNIRPKYSSLKSNFILPPWEDSLYAYLKERRK